MLAERPLADWVKPRHRVLVDRVKAADMDWLEVELDAEAVAVFAGIILVRVLDGVAPDCCRQPTVVVIRQG